MEQTERPETCLWRGSSCRTDRFPKVILASASPRRTELLTQAGLPHVILPSECEEKIHSDDPADAVAELAAQKAEAVCLKYGAEHKGEAFLVIGADTVVAVDGRILGKPKDEEEAFKMLSDLQGRRHQVYTGVALFYQDERCSGKRTFCECSKVQLYPVGADEIKCYIASGEPMDKAGAYGIQGRFAVHVKAIEGDYNNIVGLPLGRLYQEWKTFFEELL